MCILTNYKKSIAKLYLDSGRGFNETETIVVPYGKNKVVERFFLAEKPILAIRFDPQENVGTFQIVSLQLTSISESQALLGMTQRIALSLPAYNGMSPEAVAMVVEAASQVKHKPFINYLN